MLARHVSDLTGPSSGAFYKLYLQIWYVVIRTVVPHTKVCEYSLYKTLLMMGRWGPKHVELTYVMNKLTHWNPLCILLDCIYITRWNTVPTISYTLITLGGMASSVTYQLGAISKKYFRHSVLSMYCQFTLFCIKILTDTQEIWANSVCVKVILHFGTWLCTGSSCSCALHKLN